jgi:DNA polymerase-3 subunit beta
MLLIQASRDALLKPLLAVTGVVDRKTTLPILSNVLISRDEEGLRFQATDLELQITTVSPELIPGQPFKITTSARKLQDILRSFPEDTPVSMEQKEGKMTLKASKSRFNVQVLSADDFPQLTIDDLPTISLQMTQKHLKYLISQTHYAMANQDMRYYLNGLLLQIQDGEMRLVGTDGHRMAYASVEVDSPNHLAEVILPRKTVLELYKLLDDSHAPIYVEIMQNLVRFRTDTMTMVSKIIDGKFPDYTRLIPMDNRRIAVIGRLTLLHAIQRASILANEKFRGVRFVLKPGILSVFCNNAEQEEAEEELEVHYEGDAFELAFNISYLQEALNSISEEYIQIAFSEGINKGTLITIPEQHQYKYVVMPMRM